VTRELLCLYGTLLKLISLFITCSDLTFTSLSLSLRTTRFNIQKFYMVFALRWVFCTDLRTDSDLCFIHH